MARGLFSGIIAGTVVSGLVVGTASVMTAIPGVKAPQATSIDVPAGSEFDQSRDDTEASLSQEQISPDVPSVPQIQAPEPDELGDIATEATQSVDQPDTGNAEPAFAAPSDGETASGVDVDTESPVLASPQTTAPQAPEGEDDLSISTEPAQPAQPDVAEESSFPSVAEPESDPEVADTDVTADTAESVESDVMVEAPSQPEVTESDTVSDAVSGAVLTEVPQAEASADITLPDATDVDVPLVIPTEAPSQPDVAQSEIAVEGARDPVVADAVDLPETADTADTAVKEAIEDAVPDTVLTEVPQNEVAQDEASQDLALLDVPDADVPQITPTETPAETQTDVPTEVPAQPTEPVTSEPSGTIDNIAPNIITNRLPSVTDSPDQTTDAPAPSSVADDQTLPPIKRFGAAFENPDGKPVMSIVLIDDGTSPIGLDALTSFPYPLSFAVDAGWSGAGDAMQKYRAAGFEVLAMINLPEAASATDTEVAMQAYFAKFPEVVAVMEGEGTGLQSSREASTQLAEILLASGHGVVMFPNGLNTAQKLIAREGVPAASVFRDFDAKNQDARTIRRFLDQAAFRANQETEGVIMVGRLRADTISALLLWGLQGRASRVALAPVSAVLDPVDADSPAPAPGDENQ